MCCDRFSLCGFLDTVVFAVTLCRLLADYSWLTEARASSLLPGCAGILAVMQHFRAEQVLVSDSDLLDGVVQYLASKGGIHDPSVGT